MLHGVNAMCLVDVDTAGFIDPVGTSYSKRRSGGGVHAAEEQSKHNDDGGNLLMLEEEGSEPASFAEHVQVHMTGMQLLMAQPSAPDSPMRRRRRPGSRSRSRSRSRSVDGCGGSSPVSLLSVALVGVVPPPWLRWLTQSALFVWCLVRAA